MTGYVKLFQSILGSSIWAGPDAELRVWIAILALKDRQHVVRISPPGLATIARVELEECRRALEKFRGPDLDSTSKEYDGRKIEDLPGGGFLVLNGAKYAAMLSKQERREYQAMKQAEYRRRKKVSREEGAKAGAQQAIREGLQGKTLCEVFAEEAERVVQGVSVTPEPVADAGDEIPLGPSGSEESG